MILLSEDPTFTQEQNFTRMWNLSLTGVEREIDTTQSLSSAEAIVLGNKEGEHWLRDTRDFKSSRYVKYALMKSTCRNNQ